MEDSRFVWKVAGIIDGGAALGWLTPPTGSARQPRVISLGESGKTWRLRHQPSRVKVIGTWKPLPA